MLRASPVDAENFRESHCLARVIGQVNSLCVMDPDYASARPVCQGLLGERCVSDVLAGGVL